MKEKEEHPASVYSVFFPKEDPSFLQQKQVRGRCDGPNPHQNSDFCRTLNTVKNKLNVSVFEKFLKLLIFYVICNVWPLFHIFSLSDNQ